MILFIEQAIMLTFIGNKGEKTMKKTIIITKLFVISATLFMLSNLGCLNTISAYALNKLYYISTSSSAWIEETKDNTTSYAELYLTSVYPNTPIYCRLYDYNLSPLTNQSQLISNTTSYLYYSQFVPFGSVVKAHFVTGYYPVSFSCSFIP